VRDEDYNEYRPIGIQWLKKINSFLDVHRPVVQKGMNKYVASANNTDWYDNLCVKPVHMFQQIGSLNEENIFKILGKIMLEEKLEVEKQLLFYPAIITEYFPLAAVAASAVMLQWSTTSFHCT